MKGDTLKKNKLIFVFFILTLLILSSVPIFADTISQTSTKSPILHDGTFIVSFSNIDTLSNTSGLSTEISYSPDMSSDNYSISLDQSLNYTDFSATGFGEYGNVVAFGGNNAFSFTITVPNNLYVRYSFKNNTLWTITSVSLVPTPPTYINILGQRLYFTPDISSSYTIQYQLGFKPFSTSDMQILRNVPINSNWFPISEIGLYYIRGRYVINGEYGEWGDWSSGSLYNPYVSSTQLNIPTISKVGNQFTIVAVDNATGYGIYRNNYLIQSIDSSVFTTSNGITFYTYSAGSNGDYQFQALGNGSNYQDSDLTQVFIVNNFTPTQEEEPISPEVPESPTNDNIINWLIYIAKLIGWCVSSIIYYFTEVSVDIASQVETLYQSVKNFITLLPNLFAFIPSSISNVIVASISISMFLGIFKLFKK